MRAGLSIRPPNTKQKGGGGGGENGYRLLSGLEVGSLVEQWQRRIGAINSNDKIELYEMLRVIEDVGKAMPGSKPHRRELLAVGEFQDGEISCIAVGYLIKIKCPWNLQVLSIAQLKMDHGTEDMVEFLNELGIEHACIIDYAFLDRWSLFDSKKWIANRHASKEVASVADRISASYKQVNKAPLVVLENSKKSLGLFWFRTKLPSQVPNANAYAFWRQKRTLDEFELRFDPPITGVSSGYATVGCHIIVDTDAPCSKVVNDETFYNARLIGNQILGRLVHPTAD